MVEIAQADKHGFGGSRDWTVTGGSNDEYRMDIRRDLDRHEVGIGPCPAANSRMVPVMSTFFRVDWFIV